MLDISILAIQYKIVQLHFRRCILKHLKNGWKDELLFCRKMIESNPKNYQVWHHRRVVVEALADGHNELRFTLIILGDDAKNYHAWEHRQWALRTFK